MEAQPSGAGPVSRSETGPFSCGCEAALSARRLDIGSLLTDAASTAPERVCVADATHARSYAVTAARVAAVAAFLRRQGIAAGDRVSILADNEIAFFESYFAVAQLGAILNPLNVRLTAGELIAILQDAESRWLIAGARFAPLWPELRAGATSLRGVLWTGTPDATDGELFETVAAGRAPDFVAASGDADRVAHLYYTSGTTGRPKGVPLTHRNVCTHAAAAIAEFALCETDVWGHFAPMFHLADAWATFAVTAVGGRHVFAGRFAAATALRAVEAHRVTLSNLVPTMLGELVDDHTLPARDVSSLRLLLSGGAPISRQLVERIIERLGCDYAQTYGMTETSPYLTVGLLHPHLRSLSRDEQLRYKCKTGRPFRGVELRVVDAAGQPVPADERTVGEIQVRGPTVTPGYWQQPRATAEAFIDGWLRTGDLAVLDREGYVDIVDRSKDMIITGGENVYSIEVESVLYRHPAVREAAVFGLADARWGEVVHAAVALRPGSAATAAELIELCRSHLARFKVPRHVAFLDALPRTGSGKIAKRLLRDAGATLPGWRS